MATQRTYGVVQCLLVFVCLVAAISYGDPATLPSAHAFYPGVSARGFDRARVGQTYVGLPMSFERNVGQTDARVAFLSHGLGYSVFLTPTEAVLALNRSADETGPKDPHARGTRRERGHVVSDGVMRMTLVGADPPQEIRGLEPLAGQSNYFTRRDSSKWRTNVSTYAKVQYTEVYPGIDIVYHGNQRQLEYDFVIASGADPGQIRLRFDGVDTRINADGDLILWLGAREIVERQPVIYQEAHGRRHVISGGYVRIGKNEIGFRVGSHDADKPLIIDPVIVYSTYLGGTGGQDSFGHPAGDAGEGIAVGSDGSVYVAGETASVDFPTLNPLQPSNAGGVDAFVAKINADGSALVFSTYFGGSGDDAVDKLALDGAENVYVEGGTNASDFPTTPGAYRTTGPGRFVFKLSPEGNRLIYSTFVDAESFAVDAAGYVYLIGETDSPTFVTRNPIQAKLAGGFDAIISKLSLDGSALVYATYFGGSGNDAGRGIGVDAVGNIYVAGMTASSDFPTRNAFQASYGGGAEFGDWWVAKITPDGSTLVYSTYLGGPDDEQLFDLAVDPSGHTYLVGQTFSTQFPVFHAVQPVLKGQLDVILAKFDETGSSLVYSTYLGGSGSDTPRRVSADPDGNAYVTGFTDSKDFPTYRAIQPHSGDGSNESDAFVTKINTSGELIYSTYLGGSKPSGGTQVVPDASGNAFVIGITEAADFPTKHALQPTLAGVRNAFIVKIADPPCPEEVTEQVDIIRFPFHSLLFGLLRFQWVSIHNKTSVPIAGPLAFVMGDLQNAVFVGSPFKTRCLSSDGDPLMIVPVGSDNVLSPNESTLTGLWFVKTHLGRITYAARILSGIPLQ